MFHRYLYFSPTSFNHSFIFLLENNRRSNLNGEKYKYLFFYLNISIISNYLNVILHGSMLYILVTPIETSFGLNRNVLNNSW